MKPFILYAGLSKAIPAWNPICLLIRWAEAPRLFSLFSSSHVFVLYPAHDGRPFFMVNEAAGTMIRWVSEPHFKRAATITHLYKFEMPEDAYRRIRRFGQLYAGAPYATLENLGILIVRAARCFGIRIRNPFGKGARAQKCSELVMRTVMREFFIYKFGPAFSLKTLQMNLMNDRGYQLPNDQDVLGVSDLYEIFEWLAEKNLIERVLIPVKGAA